MEGGKYDITVIHEIKQDKVIITTIDLNIIVITTIIKSTRSSRTR